MGAAQTNLSQHPLPAVVGNEQFIRRVNRTVVGRPIPEIPRPFPRRIYRRRIYSELDRQVAMHMIDFNRYTYRQTARRVSITCSM